MNRFFVTDFENPSVRLAVNIDMLLLLRELRRWIDRRLPEWVPVRTTVQKILRGLEQHEADGTVLHVEWCIYHREILLISFLELFLRILL